MIKGKINLAAFSHAVMDVKRADGTTTKAIVIPIAENALFLSDKGNVYCDFVAREIPVEKRKGEDSHLINQSVGKEAYDLLRAAQKYPPTLGALRSGVVEQAPTQETLTMSEPGLAMPF